MKLPVILFMILLFAGNAFAQPGKRDYKVPRNHSMFYKEWIGPHGEYLHIKEDSAYLASPGGRKYATRFDDNILVLINDGEEDSFAIAQISKDTLTLKAISELAAREMGTHEPLSFVRHAALIDPSFSFQKVFFSSFGGMVVGNYGAVQIQADSTGTLLFSCTPGRLMRSGTFKGQLSLEQLQKLNELVKYSVPERISGSSRSMVDAPTVELKVWYKNTMVRFWGPVVPWMARPVTDYLISFINTVKMEKVNNDFGIEQ